MTMMMVLGGESLGCLPPPPYHGEVLRPVFGHSEGSVTGKTLSSFVCQATISPTTTCMFQSPIVQTHGIVALNETDERCFLDECVMVQQ